MDLFSSKPAAVQDDACTVPCQVPGCGADMAGEGLYFRRFKICRGHCKAEQVQLGGCYQRFCQQCHALHPLDAFDGTRRSCRAGLKAQRTRRRMRHSAQSDTPPEHDYVVDAQPPATEPPTAASPAAAPRLPTSRQEQQDQQQQHQQEAGCDLDSPNPACDLLLPLDFPLLDQMLHLPPQSPAAPAAISSPLVLPCTFLDSLMAADMQTLQKETPSLAVAGTIAGFMEAVAAAPPALLNRQAATPQLAAGMLPGSVAPVPGLHHHHQQQCCWLSAPTMAGGLLDGSVAVPGGVAARAFSSRGPTSPAASSSSSKRAKLADGMHAGQQLVRPQQQEQQRDEQKKQQLVALLLRAKKAQEAAAEQQPLAERHQQRQQQATEQMLPAWLRAFVGMQKQQQQQGRPETVANAAAAAADPKSFAAMRLHAHELLPGVPQTNGDASSSSGSNPRVQRLATTLASMPPLGLELLQSALQLVQQQLSGEEEQQEQEEQEGKGRANLLHQLLPASSGASAAGLLDLEIESAMERELLQQLQQNSSSSISSHSMFDLHCLQPSLGDFGRLLGPLPLGSGGGQVLGGALSDMLAGQQLLPQQHLQAAPAGLLPPIRLSSTVRQPRQVLVPAKEDGLEAAARKMGDAPQGTGFGDGC